MGASLAALASIPLALLADGIILVLAFLDGRRAPRATVRRTVRGTRDLNAVLDVDLRVRIPSDTTVRITDDPGPGLERLPPGETGAVDGSTTDGATFHAPADETVRVAYGLGLRRRGDRTLGPIHVRTLGPWGLAWREDTVEVEDRIRVQPGIERLKKERIPGLRPELAVPGLRRLRRYGEGSEFESLRAYQPGDDPRTVDWKASARRREPVVRKYQVERNQSLVLAVDAGRLMREWIGDRERLDHALAAALLLVERARSFGDRVGLLVFDREVRLVVPAGPVKLATLADALAGVESRLVEPNYPIAFATLRRTFRKRSLVVVFSDIIDASASRALVRGLAGTARHHLPVAVAIRNPDIEAAARRPATDEKEVFRRAAAEELLDARARALQRMRKSGVQTVDALPGSASDALLARYSEIKRRGLL